MTETAQQFSTISGGGAAWMAGTSPAMTEKDARSQVYFEPVETRYGS